MKALSTSRKLERSEQLKMLRRHGTPLPQQAQGEGESEGLFEATDMDSKTPHLHPLFFSERRGEKGQVGSGAKLGGHNVDGGDFALVKPAINQCWRQ
jgi:hypothetical protein